MARTAAYTALNELMIDAVTGRLGKYTTVKGLAQKGATIAAKTGINSAVNNYLANSIAKRYNTDGSLAAGQKRTGGRKEKAISQSIKIASTIAPILLNVASYNYKKARYERAVNEEKFRSWGSRILTEKTRNVVWADPESGTYVFDPN